MGVIGLEALASDAMDVEASLPDNASPLSRGIFLWDRGTARGAHSYVCVYACTRINYMQTRSCASPLEPPSGLGVVFRSSGFFAAALSSSSSSSSSDSTALRAGFFAGVFLDAAASSSDESVGVAALTGFFVSLLAAAFPPSSSSSSPPPATLKP